MRPVASVPIVLAAICAVLAAQGAARPDRGETWAREWPQTDFSKRLVSLDEIEFVLPKDAIAAIDHPRFAPVDDILLEEAKPKRKRSWRRRMRISEDTLILSERDPVISVEINGDARAYPLRIMIYHEIVNDVVGGAPVAVTYCPLCNHGVVYDRVIDGREVAFGVTGMLRKSDLVMYDGRTESWWQQYGGEAIVGAHAGRKLNRRVTRLESFASFMARYPRGRVLVPNDPRAARYGRNPYLGYDSERRPFLYRGGMPEGVRAMARVVAVDGVAYSLTRLASSGIIEEDGLRLTWTKGQASALDAERVADGRDVGDVVVQRRNADGEWVDVAYDVIFAFVFHAFHPDGEWRL